jgi:hypothetical protein
MPSKESRRAGRMPQEDIMRSAQERRDRILGYMTQDPPMPVARIRDVEGITDRTARMLIARVQEETGVQYNGLNTRDPPGSMPFGLTTASLRLRQKLGDYVYLLNQRGDKSEKIGRNRAAFRMGLNNREQIRAEQRPFNHDWKLSQIERLARELNRDPMEFLLSCLTS